MRFVFDEQVNFSAQVARIEQFGGCDDLDVAKSADLAGLQPSNQKIVHVQHHLVHRSPDEIKRLQDALLVFGF